MFCANLRASAHTNSASTDERRAVLLTFACRLRFIDGAGIVFGEVSGRGAELLKEYQRKKKISISHKVTLQSADS